MEPGRFQQQRNSRGLVAHIVPGRQGWKIRLSDYVTIPTIGSQNWSDQDVTAIAIATTIVTAHGHASLHCCCPLEANLAVCTCFPEPLVIDSKATGWPSLVLCLPPSCKGGLESD